MSKSEDADYILKLSDSCYEQVYGYVRQICCSRELVEKVVEDVFLLAYECCDRVRSVEKPLHWLYHAVKYVLICMVLEETKEGRREKFGITENYDLSNMLRSRVQFEQENGLKEGCGLDVIREGRAETREKPRRQKKKSPFLLCKIRIFKGRLE